MILVTGATGTIGADLVHVLLDRGAQVRVLARDPAKSRGLFGDRVEIAQGDFNDHVSVRKAVDGVDRVFLNSPSLEGFVGLQKPLIDAAANAGVKHLVRLSVMGADAHSPISYARGHFALDEHLKSTSLPWTILAPSGFLQNVLASAATIKQGAIYGSAGDGAVGFIDARDIADVAVAVLTNEGHVARTYVLTGAQTITYADIAAAFAAELGHDVRYVDVPPEAFGENLLGLGLPAGQVQDILDLFTVYRAGYAATVTPNVANILGRAPRSLATFVHDYRAVITNAA